MGSGAGSASLLGAVVLLAVLGPDHLAEGGCAGRCCHSRDWSCLSTDWSMQRVYGTCFCDDTCARTRDCCFDYFTECPAQDCVVGPWGPWSGCARPCRPSTRGRRRRVEQQPANGGAACPRLEERAGCLEYRDHTGGRCGPDLGPAFITSMAFGQKRPTHDSYGTPLDPGFCVEFTLQSRTAHCAVETRPHTHWTRYITEGFTVCVACQLPAMHNNTGSCQGDGLQSDKEAVLHWQALEVPRCAGTWRKVHKTQRCRCPPQHSFVFI
ncbi:unnamed protein product [Gadus morhua 'NCC']